MQTCNTCHIQKPFSDFSKSSKNIRGYENRCKTCRNYWYKEIYAKRQKIVVHSLYCPSYGTTKPTSDFSADNGKKNGFYAKCKACAKIKATQRVAKIHNEFLEHERLPVETLICRTCKLTKHASEFHRQKGSLSGYRNQCKSCRFLLEADYRATHSSDTVSRVNIWRKNHPEQFKQLAVQTANTRRARKNGAPLNDFTSDQWLEILSAHKYRCVYCPDNCQECKNKTHEFHQEHLTPVAKNGSYTLANILPSCPTCNSKKGTGPVLKPVQPMLLTIAPAKG